MAQRDHPIQGLLVDLGIDVPQRASRDFQGDHGSKDVKTYRTNPALSFFKTRNQEGLRVSGDKSRIEKQDSQVS